METQYQRGERHVYRHIAGTSPHCATRRQSRTAVCAHTDGRVNLEAPEEWCTTQDLVNALVSEYQVTHEQAVADVEEFLIQLEEIKAVIRREPAA